MKFTRTILLLGILLNFNLIHALRILGLFPLQARSHYTICEALMRGLAAKGHQVDVYSHFPLEKPITNYNDFSLAGSLSAVKNNLTYDIARLASGTKFLQRYLQDFGGSVCKLMELPIFQDLFHHPPNDPPYDVIVTELSVVHCYIPWGHRLNIPVVGLVTTVLLSWHYESFGVPINLATEPDIHKPYSAPMTFLEKLDNMIIHNMMKHTFATNTDVQDAAVEKYFGAGLPNQWDLLKDISLVLVNHDMSISGVKTFPPLVVPVGGLHIIDHNETLPKIVQEWLDESRDGCVYFSFGSALRLETFPNTILQELYKAFKNIAPVQVLLKIAKPEELPLGLPSNVLTQPWLNQVQVLKHPNVKAFVTHGGMMGTQESVYYGVPMIGIPLCADQHFNVECCVERKIALRLDLSDVTEKTFTDAVREVLNNPVYKNTMKKLSSKFKDQQVTTMDTAVFWVEYVSKHGKDALKSPITDISWWQASLLDVYGFIFASILIIVYTTILLLRKLIRIVLRPKSTAKPKVKVRKTD